MFASQGRRRFLARAVAVAVTGAALAGALLVPLPAQAADGPDVIINEAYLKGGSSGAPYLNKFIELYNAGDEAQVLDGWSLQYRSATGAGSANSTVPLEGTIQPGGYFLIQGASNAANGAALPTPDQVTTFNPGGQNGTLWLADSTTAGNPGTGDVAGAAGVVDLIGYGSSNTHEGAAAAPDAGGTGVQNSLVRSGFVDTDQNGTDITVATTVTPQASGSAGEPEPEPTPTDTPTPTPTATPGDVIPIAEIQGTGDTSPLAGQTVTARGVVTAAYPTGGYNGFYLQTPGTGGAIDASHAASDAVFVYGGSGAAGAAVAGTVSIGDYVEITGKVSEYNGTTEITVGAADITALDETPAAVEPAQVAWPADEAGRESLEGMLLAPEGSFTVSDTYDTNYYASIGLAAGDSPLLTPTEVALPGTAEYDAVVADNAARAVTLDDGAATNFNSTANKAIPLPYLSTTAPVRVGAPVTFTQPVILEYRNSMWNFQPTQQLTVDNAAEVQPATFGDTRTAAPENVGGDIQLAGFNVLNYFTTTGEDAGCTSFYTDRAGEPVTVNDCGPDGPRGAADDEDLARQQAKIVAAINALGAEVVSLEEIENSAKFGEDRDSALASLVAALNDALGADEWDYVRSPAADALPPLDAQDVIRTAFIYKKASVSPVGDSVVLDDPAFANARQPLAQAFAPAGSEQAAFVAVVNHFKSKGDNRDNPATGDNADGPQGAYNGDRVRQATALLSFADAVAADAGTESVFLLGDFNAYSAEDPVTTIEAAGYADLGDGTGEYSYAFEGAVGSLDHVFASPAAQALVTGTDIWNINSGESIALEYSRYNYNATDFYDASPYRSSDHDPVVVGIDLPAATVSLNLLNINDFHGRIDANTVKFAGTIEQLRAEGGEDNTLFLSDGDNIGASLFASSLQQDAPTIDVLNTLELQASAVGNHEFDQGYEVLNEDVTDRADFSYLGANVYTKGTTEPALDEYATFEVQGLTVAVIGAVTQETPTLVSPGGIATLDFGDPVEAVNRVAAQLTDGDPSNGEADVIIAEYHEGAAAGETEKATLEDELADGKAFANIVTNTSAAVDAIFTGHTHKKYAWEAPIPGESGKTRPVVQTGSYGENIGQVVLTVDAETGEVVSHTQRNVARLASQVFPNDAAATAAASAKLDADLVSAYPRVAEVKTIVDAALAEADVKGRVPVGSVADDITTAYADGSYVDGVYTGGTRDDRSKQSTLGNLVADSLVAALSAERLGGAEIGIVNPGGLRSELFYGDDGVITYAEANAVLPFVNNLWTTTLTGAQFKSVLEEQWQTDADGNVPSRDYLALGLSDNVQYTFDADAPRGSHITGIWIDGVPIDPAATYRVGSFSFLLQGGDNFRTLAQGTDTRDSGLVDRDAWVAFLGKNPDLEPSFASRSAQVTGVPTEAAAGSTITFQVSRLDLTSLGSPANTILEPTIGEAAYAPVSVVDGNATVSLTLPSDASGPTEIVLTAPDSGTEVRVPLTVTADTGTPTPPGGGSQPTQPSTPAPPSALTPGLQNAISVVGGQLAPGATITISVGTQYAGQWVAVWLRSEPVFLGWHLVDAAGTITVTLPAGITGDHRLVVQNADGEVIGWQQVSIRALAATGTDLSGPIGAGVLALLLLGVGAAARTAARRRTA